MSTDPPPELPRASFLEAEKADKAKQDALQPALFTMEEADECLMIRDGLYSGERLFSRRLDIYNVVVALLRDGNSIRAIKKACRVHHKTIQAVAEREGILIDTGKEKVIGDLRLAQHLLAETLVEDIIEGRISPSAKPLALGIITDKLELLTGGVTDRTETVHTNADAPRTWGDWMDRVKKANGREIAAGTGEVGRIDGAKGPASVHRLPAGDLTPRAQGASAASLGERDARGGNERAIDAESAALPLETSDATRRDTQSPPESASSTAPATDPSSPALVASSPDPACPSATLTPGEGGDQGPSRGGHQASG